MSTISKFNGLNNVADPLRLGLPWLTQADNVDITGTGAIKKRTGYRKTFSGSITGAYATLDFSRLYIVDGGVLKSMTGPGTAVALRDGLSAEPMHFTEVNGQVLFNNGIDSGIISPDGSVSPWRESTLRDTEFLDAAGNPVSALLYPLPSGAGIVQHWRGRIYAAQSFPEADQSVLWFSQPLGWHLFALDTDFMLLPGVITMLAPHAGALIIGTDRAIHAFDGTSIAQLAPYGAVPGQHWVDDDGRTLFWTHRGLCSAIPFSNLTDRQISVAPGVSAGGALVQKDGHKRYLVAIQQGGGAFNSTDPN